MKLVFGCIAPSINEQLDEQNIVYDTAIMEKLQKKHILLCELKFTGLFTPGQINKAYDKLFKQVEEHIKRWVI